MGKIKNHEIELNELLEKENEMAITKSKLVMETELAYANQLRGELEEITQDQDVKIEGLEIALKRANRETKLFMFGFLAQAVVVGLFMLLR